MGERPYLALADAFIRKHGFERVYCQQCLDDITGENAEISGDGKTFCDNPETVDIESCIVQALVYGRYDGKDTIVLHPVRVQELILRGDIIHYGDINEPNQ